MGPRPVFPALDVLPTGTFTSSFSGNMLIIAPKSKVFHRASPPLREHPEATVRACLKLENRSRNPAWTIWNMLFRARNPCFVPN